MITGIAFILIMCLMGGAIAYGADLLGRHLGKKRLTIWKMRPRHTAAVLTAGAGVLIPLLTTLFLSIVSTDVRTMLVEGANAAKERDSVRADLNTLQPKAERLQQETNSLSVDKGILLSEKTALEKAKFKVELGYKKTKSELDRSIKESLRLSRDTSKLRIDAGKFRKDIAHTRTELTSLKGEKASVEEQRKTIYARVRLYEEESKSRLSEITNLERQQKDLDKLIRQLRTAEDGAREQLASTTESYSAQISLLEEQRQKVQGDLEAIRELQQRAENEIIALQNAKESLASDLGQVRTKPLIYSAREEIVRIPVQEQLSPNEAQLVVDTLMRQARQDANSKGAIESNGYKSVSLIPLRDRTDRFISIEQQEAAIVKNISGRTEQYVMIAYAMVNSFEGEFVRCVIDVQKNNLVYEQGEIVAETRIDGTQDETKILKAIEAFLVDKLSKKALSDGIIPAIGKPNPLGEIADQQIVQLIKEIKEFNRTVRLQAVAVQGTRRADRIRLEFRVK